MLLTEAQLQEIREIIADHHNAFVANVLSPQVIAPEILERLKQKGLYAPKLESVRDSYLYGQLLATLDDPSIAHMNYEDFKRHIRTHPVPLTEIERQAITMAQQQAGQYAVGLGNRIDQDTGQILIEADHVLRQQLRDEIKTATAENIARRESVKKLKSDLGWKTRDWSRDWDRIAVTEKQNAMQHGVADSIAAHYGTEERVAKRPMPDACEHCKRLHIGPDGQPRIFKLSTLIANGVNFRLKTGEWQAVIGPVHPHCQCQLIRVPDGYGFDEDGRLVPGGKLGIEYEDEADLEASLRAEDELKKSGRVTGQLQYQGMTIRIESPAGSVRHWTDQEGHKGSTKMHYPYGFVTGTEGQDGDEVDVFVGPDPRAPLAFVVHQQNPKTKQYDETKCFVGFPDKKTAEKVYRMHYDRPDFALWTDEMDIESFKRWLGGLVKSVPPRAERFVFLEKGGPYFGPRGGKYRDPERTQPWKESASTSQGSKTSSHPLGEHVPASPANFMALPIGTVLRTESGHIATKTGADEWRLHLKSEQDLGVDPGPFAHAQSSDVTRIGQKWYRKLDIQKAEGAQPNYTPAVSERALGAVRGTATNVLMGSPPRGLPKTDPDELTPDVREILRLDEDLTVPESMKRDLQIYDFQETLDRHVRTVDIPEEWKEEFKRLRTVTAERLREDTQRSAKQMKPVSRNTTDVTESKPLEKSADSSRKIVRQPVRSSSGQGVSR